MFVAAWMDTQGGVEPGEIAYQLLSGPARRLEPYCDSRYSSPAHEQKVCWHRRIRARSTEHWQWKDASALGVRTKSPRHNPKTNGYASKTIPRFGVFLANFDEIRGGASILLGRRSVEFHSGLSGPKLTVKE